MQGNGHHREHEHHRQMSRQESSTAREVSSVHSAHSSHDPQQSPHLISSNSPAAVYANRRAAAQVHDGTTQLPIATQHIMWDSVSSSGPPFFSRDGDVNDKELKQLFALEDCQCPERSIRGGLSSPKLTTVLRVNYLWRRNIDCRICSMNFPLLTFHLLSVSCRRGLYRTLSPPLMESELTPRRRK